MATYTGPTVSPVFVTGLINDAWAEAVARTADARAAVAAVTTAPLQSDIGAPLEAPDDYAVEQADMTEALPGPGDALVGQLAALLSSFIASHYPTVSMPDGPAAWERVVDGFVDADNLRLTLERAESRIHASWSARGLSVPAAASAHLRARSTWLQERGIVNTDIVRKTHRAGVALVQYELVMRAQLEALEAARAYLVGSVLALQSKADEEQIALVRSKEAMQGSFFRYLGARLEANSVTLDELALGRRIELDADLSAKDRETFVLRLLVQTALEECMSIASQASAAINRVSASATVGGSERTP